jgi:23S rRNA pseudouridine2605 synthase
MDDPEGRPCIGDLLIGREERLFHVGRLDAATEGLLLLTNDGELKREMELPANGVPRTYRARAFGDVSQAQLEELIHGITIEGVNYGSIDANLERGTGHNRWIEMTLTEGKNREVRRVLEHLGLKVSRLIRTAYGPFALADLARGAVDEIRKEELSRFRSSLNKGSAAKASGDTREPTKGFRKWAQESRKPLPNAAPPTSRRSRSGPAGDKPPARPPRGGPKR